MDLIYSQYGAHYAGIKGTPRSFLESLGYIVLKVKCHPACDNVIMTVTRKKFQAVGCLPDFVKKSDDVDV